jgi:hypothetical protein
MSALIKTTATLLAWARVHPSAAAVLAKALNEQPNGGMTVYVPREPSSAPTSSQADSKR